MSGTAWPALRGSFPENWIGRGLRDLGRADDSNITLKFSRFRMMLTQHGLSFDDLAEKIERIGIAGKDDLLEPDSPFTLATLTRLYRTHGRRVEFLPFLPWYGECVSRLRRGQQPTALDWQQRGDLQARLRIGKTA